jgi:hypothetical protein
MSSTLRLKAINTFEDLLKNKDIEITLEDFTSFRSFIEESTDPLFMVGRYIMRRMLTQSVYYIVDAVASHCQIPA